VSSELIQKKDDEEEKERII